MTDLHLDTNVVLWLAQGELDRIPGVLRERLAVDPLRFSPMVRLEITYLHEIGRITEPAHRILPELEHSIGLLEHPMAFEAVTKAAETLTWTRDPFDRLIAAHALVSFGVLATSDEKIRNALGSAYTVWD
ncbi:type II toxin-antitoxin system VapC family toxin [Nocardioides stalactiti]|uniref:type II toxin-antitoxin system VapC family toxin n=1 Tax=Nocardioides stalactiti TaxID=2755356 RepID=UPI0016018240|nr:PIN domain-containing protein [Nocardioides stalactiti]